MRKWYFAKTHATLNDFIVLRDRHNMVSLEPEDVRLLCARRAGVGADGVLRAVKARHIPEWDGDPELWFMDYRNADGSVAEMCGNGLRAFVRYLLDEGMVGGDEIPVATRAGLRTAWPLVDGRIRTDLGRAVVADDPVMIHVEGRSWPALTVKVGNPHAVVRLESESELESLALTEQPVWEPAERFPAGINVEFIVELAARHLRMRVFERGAGETMSCGTGVVAAVAAHARSVGVSTASYRVDVPGGTLEVDLAPERVYLTGPALVVGTGEVLLP